MSETENNELAAGKQSKEPRSNQKLKLLYLAKILLNNTDANHDITLDEILNRLHAYDVTAARKSLYDDIAQLNDFGIKTQKMQYGRTVHYKVIGRAFELAELKLLVDSVAAAKFITEEKSNELIKKLESLTSRQEAATLQRQVYVAGRVKTMNSDIMKNVDAIHNAINSPIANEAIIPITTIGQQIDVIARTAMDLLVKQMDNRKQRKPEPDLAPTHKKMAPVLIRRETTS